MGTFVIKQRKNGSFYFFLKAANHQVICTSQDYASIAACYNGIESVKKHSQTENIVDETEY